MNWLLLITRFPLAISPPPGPVATRLFSKRTSFSEPLATHAPPPCAAAELLRKRVWVALNCERAYRAPQLNDVLRSNRPPFKVAARAETAPPDEPRLPTK